MIIFYQPTIYKIEENLNKQNTKWNNNNKKQKISNSQIFSKKTKWQWGKPWCHGSEGYLGV